MKGTAITLIHHPTVALKIFGFTAPHFESFSGDGIYLGNVYRRIIPPSLPRVASVIEKELPARVEILDLRIADSNREEAYKFIDWEGYQVEVRRVGAPFSYAEQAIGDSDWIGLSSHFTFESQVIRDLISYARQVKPTVKVMVGGADVRARPRDYLNYGADLVFSGDFNPEALKAFDGESKIVGAYLHPFDELTKPSFHKLPHLMEYSDSHDGRLPEGVPTPVGFIYFTRGCPRECDFCESRKTGYEVLGLEHSISMLEHYRDAGITTLNLADDNLLLQAANKHGRQNLLTLLGTMREMGFAWEYPNGLEIGMLLRNGRLDEELIRALFSHSVDPETNRITGAYRVYIPVETFDRRGDYRKLKPLQEQNQIIAEIAGSGIPELDFGVVVAPSADQDTFSHIEEGYENLKNLIAARGSSKARYSIFHLIPISNFRSMPTKYSVDEFPEGWNFHFPVYEGVNFSPRELFERRLQAIKKIDRRNYENMKEGAYSYA